MERARGGETGGRPGRCGLGASRALPLALAAAAALCPACEQDGGDAGGVGRPPIVGGSLETGYAAVGALGEDDGHSFRAFCTGTLVADRWVLTAAHCVVRGASTIDPSGIGFYVGPNATVRSSGTVTACSSVHPHEGYVPADPTAGTVPENDIALVRLSSSVPGVAPLAANEESIARSAGAAITWVGFGVSTPPSGGVGQKRSAAGHLDSVYWWHLLWLFEGALPCSGDSGGPVFMDFGGTPRVVGVINTADEGCDEGGTGARVDTFAPWIAATMAGRALGECDLTGGDCGHLACWFADVSRLGCLPSDGLALGSDCDPETDDWTTGVPCADGLACVGLTMTGAGRCVAFCEPGGCAAGESCDLDAVSEEGVGLCLPDREDCELLGGDCGAGGACMPLEEGGGFCYPSEGLGRGEACAPDPSTWESAPCADGLICLPTSTGASDGLCYGFCLETSDCGALEHCRVPIFSNVDDLGGCFPCLDDDDDGVCNEDDCDREDPEVYPGAPEACDGADNDCDGEVDEACGCEDRDGDGVCPPDDCDDGDPSAHPGAAEDCGNGADDDCDGAADGADDDCARPDGGASEDAGPGADGGPDGGGPGERAGGCTCSAAPRRAPSAALSLLLLGLLATPRG